MSNLSPALVARYRELCREHDHVVAWEVAALSLAGSRKDIRDAAKALLSNAPAVEPAITERAGRTGGTMLLDDGTATTGTVERKAQG